MSFCRWSSDNFKSDVYCYENVSGAWTTHVAGNRIISPLPDMPGIDVLMADQERYAKLHAEHMAALNAAERESIGLPHDCETFNDAGPAEMAERLKYLQGLGYRVPAHVFEALAEEVAEQNTTPSGGTVE